MITPLSNRFQTGWKLTRWEDQIYVNPDYRREIGHPEIPEERNLAPHHEDSRRSASSPDRLQIQMRADRAQLYLLRPGGCVRSGLIAIVRF